MDFWSIEEIVTDERCKDELVVDTCEEISFPNLRDVVLVDLPNLKCFCPSANFCFKMTSLRDVTIRRCPQMLSFTYFYYGWYMLIHVSMFFYNTGGTCNSIKPKYNVLV